jgi:hypothetical protein
MAKQNSTVNHFAGIVRFNPAEIKRAVSEVEGFNAKLAVIITQGVGTMACAYVFALITLISLPDKIKEGKKGIIEWVAQTFLQLVLLSIIMVGQRVQGAASDARAEDTDENTKKLIDLLDVHTKGGLADVMAAVEQLDAKVSPKA